MPTLNLSTCRHFHHESQHLGYPHLDRSEADFVLRRLVLRVGPRVGWRVRLCHDGARCCRCRRCCCVSRLEEQQDFKTQPTVPRSAHSHQAMCQARSHERLDICKCILVHTFLLPLRGACS